MILYPVPSAQYPVPTVTSYTVCMMLFRCSTTTTGIFVFPRKSNWLRVSYKLQVPC